MEKKTFLICILVFASSISFAQTKKINDPTLAIYKLISNDRINIKDSLVIFALNFELDILKKDGRTIITNMVANDSLAFTLFPSHKKFFTIDFTPLMGKKNKIKLLIPILIYGSSAEKVEYKDKDGNPLISLNAAVNAAYSLHSPVKYNNQEDANTYPGFFLKDSKHSKVKTSYREVIMMNTITYEIHNIR